MNEDVVERNGHKIYIDQFGNESSRDDNGNKIPPLQSARTSKDGEFTIYDDSQGNCGLCGRLGCHGGCFK